MRAWLLVLAACSSPVARPPAKPQPPATPTTTATTPTTPAATTTTTTGTPAARAEVIVDEVVQPTALAADATHLYFVAGSTIWRAEKQVGAKPTRLGLGTRPVGIGLDAAYVWWGDTTGVFRVPKQGGQIERVTQGNLGVVAFSKRGPEINVATTDGELVRLSGDGKIVDQNLVQGQYQTLVIADDGSYVGTDEVIMRIAKNGTMNEIVHANTVGLAVVGERVIYTANDQVYAVVGQKREALGTSRGTVLSLVVDKAHVYWGTQSSQDSAIYRVPLAGGETETFERLGPNAGPRMLLVDGEYLYWTNEAGRQIVRKRR